MLENLKTKSKYLVPAVLGSTSLMAFPAHAAEGTPVAPTDWSAVLTAMTSQISVSTIVAALATFITAGIGLVFMWWGVRKLVRTVMSAFRRGKLSV